jgi:vacuolar protein sorting-associated protein 35
MIKDKLPDVGNEYEGEKSKFEDTLKFILQNLEEMNRLWIRLSTGCTGNERLLKEKERNELKVLVGENITRLSSLEGLSLEIYQNDVLPKIITILLESKDQLSQQYLMECIIHAFPDDFNIQCMSTILDTCTRLVPTVDIKSLFIALMEKLAKYVGDTGRTQEEIIESSEKIFDLLKVNIDKIIEEGSSGNMDTLKLIELQVAFMKFTLKGCPDKLVTVNHILTSTVSILSKRSPDYKISQEGIKLIGRLLSVPLESTLSIFEMPQFPVLMTYLDFSSRSTLSLRIIESLVNGSSLEKLDSSSKVSILLDFIKPLLFDSSDSIESDSYQFEYEQQSVAKLIFKVNSTDPTKQFEMMQMLKNVFLKGGIKRQRYTLPPLVNALFILASVISHALEIKYNNTEVSKPNMEEFISKVETNMEAQEYIKYIQKVYLVINDIITQLGSEYPELAFKLYLNGISSINDLKYEKEQFEEIGYNMASLAIGLLQEGKVDADRKLSLIILFVGTITSVSFLSKDNMNMITSNLQQVSTTLVKRSDQCIAMLNCSHLFFNEILKDTNKVNECLQKAKRFAEFAMTNAQNLNLFVLLLNKYLFYIEKGTTFICSYIVNDIIEVIRNHILTIKTENTNATFLSEIEKYFETTIDIISNRKKMATHKIFEEIVI